MTPARDVINELFELIVDELDIPRSHYERAAKRHQSLGDYFSRPSSRLTPFKPHVTSQGSFRFGTVIRPLLAGEEYDLDNVTILSLPKDAMTQKELKRLYGMEVRDYATEHSMLAPLEEKDRCWRLEYADEASFHLDTLPCVPEEGRVIAGLIAGGVPGALAAMTVAITDRRHREYDLRSSDWLTSNPQGFAAFFEQKAKLAVSPHIRELLDKRAIASVDAVPPYALKSPLQRAVQLLKRHRDVMFRADRSKMPISMIITNLAAQAYQGEPTVRSAITRILTDMPGLVRTSRPRVPNPANFAEDYADKWSRNPDLEPNFWNWLAQATVDLLDLDPVVDEARITVMRRNFAVRLPDEATRHLVDSRLRPVAAAPAIRIQAPPQPWGSD